MTDVLDQVSDMCYHITYLAYLNLQTHEPLAGMDIQASRKSMIYSSLDQYNSLLISNLDILKHSEAISEDDKAASLDRLYELGSALYQDLMRAQQLANDLIDGLFQWISRAYQLIPIESTDVVCYASHHKSSQDQHNHKSHPHFKWSRRKTYVVGAVIGVGVVGSGVYLWSKSR